MAYATWIGPRFACRFFGDIVAGQHLTDEARKVAGYLFGQLRGKQTFSTQTFLFLEHKATITVTVMQDRLGQRAFADITVEPEGPTVAAFVAYVWLPEGFVITPKTEESEFGYGLPKVDGEGELINPPFGTLDGPFRECLLNRFLNNLYTPAGKTYSFKYWPVAYTQEDFDEPGGFGVIPVGETVEDRDKVLQFNTNERFTANEDFPLEEKIDGTWFGHWPEEIEYNGYELRMFELVNLLRGQEDRTQLYKPLKGPYRPASAILREMSYVNAYLEHNSEDYREGYETVKERLYKDGANITGGENLILAIPQLTVSGEALAGQYFQGWYESPGHYANMVSDAWDVYPDETDDEFLRGVFPARATILDLSETSSSIDRYKGGIGEATVDPPQTAGFGAQVFETREKWVYHGNHYWEGDEGRISWTFAAPHEESNFYTVVRVSDTDPSVFAVPTAKRLFDPTYLSANAWDLPQPKGAVYIHGRRYELPGMDENHICMGASLRRIFVEGPVPGPEDDRDILYVQVAILNRVSRALEFRKRRIDELGRCDFAATVGDEELEDWELYTTFDLDDIYNVSTVRWSQDGTKAVFRTEEPSGSPVTQAVNQYFWYSIEAWPSDAAPRDPLTAKFWELTEPSGAPTFTLIETVSGLTLNFTYSGSTPYQYGYDVTGTFSVAKDYVDNDIVTLQAYVNDEYLAVTGASPPGGANLQANFYRKLIFPSTKELVYLDYEAADYATVDPAVLVSIDYINLQTEDVGGFRLTYETDIDSSEHEIHIRPATFELFMNDTVLDTYTDTTGSRFSVFAEFEGALLPMNVDVPDSIGYRAYRVDFFPYVPPTGEAYPPNGFIPFNCPTGHYLYRTNYDDDTWYNYVWAPAYPQKVCYGSKILPIAHGFLEPLGVLDPYGDNEDSVTGRAWSVRGPGYGLYNPSPWFGSTSMMYKFVYDTEELAGGYNLKNYFTCWGYAYPAPYYGSDNALQEKDLRGYETELDLEELTGLGEELIDDIFPIGVI